MKIAKLFLSFIFLLQGFHLWAQGEANENYYLGEVNAFSKIPINSHWDYYSKGSVSFDSLERQAHWQKANPAFLQDAKGKPLQWSGIGWFKQTFTVPDSLIGKSIALKMGHLGASEIHVDGKLVMRYGDVFAHAGVGSFVPRVPFSATLNNSKTHTLLVRYATHDFDKIIKPRSFTGFSLSLAPLSQSYLQPTNIYTQLVFSTTLYISFCLFFFIVFLFYPKRIASLMTALFFANFAVLFGLISMGIHSTDIVVFSWTNLGWKSAIAMVSGWGLFMNYAIHYGKLPRRSWWVVPIMLGNIAGIFFPQFLYPFFYINALVLLETWRIIILNVRDKKAGGWILAIGKFTGDLLFLLFISGMVQFQQPFIAKVGSYLSDLIGPLTLGLHLAWEFGSSNHSLQEQLSQVQKLSKENLEKEQEKQHILATQNETLEQQVEERTAELKASQAQLIQSEKLASLGELTAGIAHEIQNPLNFVNNFAEVSAEMLVEMKEELKSGRTPEAIHIADDLEVNLQKINHHGQRASNIVKGMLEHSRASSGTKQPTDLNALADEYLRLAYYGLRAKDSSFNATMETHFDASLPKIEIIPQDIGRVLLNLINNAFYAVNEKAKQDIEGYEPTVTVSSAVIGDKVEIRVKDNGNGIPEAIRDKIFQPFFTTKPTGQGTGLGLSLAHDIVVKGHGGTIEVHSTADQGTDFIIQLKTIFKQPQHVVLLR
jgi:signal transduction histidine kinase